MRLHHVTFNLTFTRDRHGGESRVHVTPMLIGAFPMMVPTDPASRDDYSTEWKWTRGQVGPFVPERLQSNQFTAQYESVPSGNHVHGVFRDLEFDWRDNDLMRDHLLHRHPHGDCGEWCRCPRPCPGLTQLLFDRARLTGI